MHHLQSRAFAGLASIRSAMGSALRAGAGRRGLQPATTPALQHRLIPSTLRPLCSQSRLLQEQLKVPQLPVSTSVLASLYQQLAATAAKIEATEGDIKKVEAQIDEINAEIKVLEAKEVLSDAQQAKLTSLRDEKKDLRDKEKDLRDKKKDLRDKEKDLRDEKKRLIIKLDDLQTSAVPKKKVATFDEFMAQLSTVSFNRVSEPAPPRVLVGHEESIEWLGRHILALLENSELPMIDKNRPTILDVAGASGIGKTAFGQHSLDSIDKYVREHLSDLPGKLEFLEQQLKQRKKMLSPAHHEDLELAIDRLRAKIASNPDRKALERIAAMPKTRVMLDFNGSSFYDRPNTDEKPDDFIARRILARYFGTSFRDFAAKCPLIENVNLEDVLDVIATKLRRDHNLRTTGDDLPWVMIVAHIDELQLLTTKGEFLDNSVNTSAIKKALDPLRAFVRRDAKNKHILFVPILTGTMPFVNIYNNATEGSISVHNLSLYSDRESLMIFYNFLAATTSPTDALAKLPDVNVDYDSIRAIWDVRLPKLLRPSQLSFLRPQVSFAAALPTGNEHPMKSIQFSVKDKELSLHLIALALVGQPIEIESDVTIGKNSYRWTDILRDGKVIVERTSTGRHVVRMPIAQLRLNMEQLQLQSKYTDIMSKISPLLPEFPELPHNTKPASASFELNGARIVALRAMLLPHLPDSDLRIGQAFLPGAKVIVHTDKRSEKAYDVMQLPWELFVGKDVYPKITLDSSRWAKIENVTKKKTKKNTTENHDNLTENRVLKAIKLTKSLDIGIDRAGPYVLAFHDGNMNGAVDVRVFIKGEGGQSIVFVFQMKHTLEGETKVDAPSIKQLLQCCEEVEKVYPAFVAVPVMLTNRPLPIYMDEMTKANGNGNVTNPKMKATAVEIREHIGKLKSKKVYVYDASNIKEFFSGMAHRTKSKEQVKDDFTTSLEAFIELFRATVEETPNANVEETPKD